MNASNQPRRLKTHDPIGRVLLDRYRIVRRLARGGMGVVYLARSEGAAGFSRPVVIKRILPALTSEENMAKMFVREARILSNLSHPNIVSVIDFAEEDDAYVMVIEYVHGYHVGLWAKFCHERDNAVPAILAIHIVIKVLDALHHAHNMTLADGTPYQIVHRDISPANVHLSAEGHVKLLDFGIARVSHGSGEYQTEEIALKGKLPYLAPELFRSAVPTPQTDLYACGVMLHEMLTGSNEFRGKEMSETVARVLNHVPSRVRRIREDVPERIDDVLDKALHKDMDHRYTDAASFARDLRTLRGLAETDVDKMLAQRLAADFTSEMAVALEVPTLEELDHAWRNPPATPPPDVLRTDPGQVHTEVDLPRPSNPRWLLWLSAALFIAAGIVGAVWQLNRPEPEVHFATRVALDQSGDPVIAPVLPPDTAAQGASLSETIEETVARHLRRFGSCKETHLSAKQSSKFTLFFEIGDGGKVDVARVSPSALAKTPLGRCYEKVASKISFAKEASGLTSTIPITIN